MDQIQIIIIACIIGAAVLAGITLVIFCIYKEHKMKADDFDDFSMKKNDIDKFGDMLDGIREY